MKPGDMLVRDDDVAFVRELRNNEILLDITWSTGVNFIAHYPSQAEVFKSWKYPTEENNDD